MAFIACQGGDSATFHWWSLWGSGKIGLSGLPSRTGETMVVFIKKKNLPSRERENISHLEKLGKSFSNIPWGKGYVIVPRKVSLTIWMFPKIGGKPPKWMVKIMENPMNKWMIWRGFTPLFLVQHPYIESPQSFAHRFLPWPNRFLPWPNRFLPWPNDTVPWELTNIPYNRYPVQLWGKDILGRKRLQKSSIWGGFFWFW